MAKWANSSLQDNGPQLLYSRAATTGRIVLHVLKAYTLGDSYATVISNSCGSVALVQADIPIAGASGASRTQTIAAKTGISVTQNAVGSGNHVAIVDSTTSEVLLVTSEATLQSLTSGNTMSTSAYNFTIPQPV